MCIKCGVITLNGKLEGLEPELQRVAKLIYDGKMKAGHIDPAMVTKIADQLMKGIFKGYGKDFSSKDLTDAERTFLGKINTNVFVFSGFKNYQQLKETSLLLKNDDGKIKSFNDFFTDVRAIDKTYNEVYLSAEYSNAVASAQMAQAWDDFEQNGVEVLTYQTAGDDKVREEHMILNGITLPMDDPFWSTYFPPNDWGCRCDAVPAPAGTKSERIPKSSLPDLPEMFQNNVAQSGIVFPKTHPYFDANDADKKSVLNQVANLIPKEESTGFVPENLAHYEKELGVEIDREIFDYLAEPVKFNNTGNKGAFYNFTTNTVTIPFDERRRNSPWNAASVVYHEFGHAADFQNGFQDLKSVKDMMQSYRKSYKDDLGNLTRVMNRAVLEAGAANDYDTLQQLSGCLDTIMSLDKRFGAGHGWKVQYGKKRIDYFDVPGFKEAEFIAHAFENRFIGNPQFKKYMPDLYEDMIELTKKFKRR